MPGPGDIMKLMGMKNKFVSSHPKFAAFIGDVAKRGVSEGEIIEISIIDADGKRTTANMKVNSDDVEMINSLKGMK